MACPYGRAEGWHTEESANKPSGRLPGTLVFGYAMPALVKWHVQRARVTTWEVPEVYETAGWFGRLPHVIGPRAADVLARGDGGHLAVRAWAPAVKLRLPRRSVNYVYVVVN